jgi:hypothetical protein
LARIEGKFGEPDNGLPGFDARFEGSGGRGHGIALCFACMCVPRD